MIFKRHFSVNATQKKTLWLGEQTWRDILNLHNCRWLYRVMTPIRRKTQQCLRQSRIHFLRIRQIQLGFTIADHKFVIVQKKKKKIRKNLILSLHGEIVKITAATKHEKCLIENTHFLTDFFFSFMLLHITGKSTGYFHDWQTYQNVKPKPVNGSDKLPCLKRIW